MALDRMEALEARVRKMVDMIQDLKETNASLEKELERTRARMEQQESESRRWEEERADIRTRIEKVLGELDSLEALEEAKEVALD
jgi:FtsZ-binding cell division protein ZapB